MGSFLDMHAPGAPFVIPNPWDVGSARMLEAMGFQALATTSAGFAFSCGVRDGATGFDAQLDHARTLAAAVEVPVSADLEKGLGDDPASAAETVRRAAAAGLAGCSIEDATGDAAKPIYDFGLAAERVAAAVEACAALESPFVFTARAENFLNGKRDLDDTLKRLEAFAKAGADVIYAPALPSLEAIRAACGLGKPVNALVAGSGPGASVDELAAVGVARISVGSAFARLAYGALIEAAAEIRAEGAFGALAKAAPFGDIEALLP